MNNLQQALFASTLPKPHMLTLQPKLCQRASKANPDEERKQKIKKPAYNNGYSALSPCGTPTTP